MRRAVKVKSVFFLPSFFPFFFPVGFLTYEPPLSAFFHSHSFVSNCRSVQVGRTRFSRCRYLIVDLGFHLYWWDWART
jgi:hypothetical protein